ncbi:MAG: SDR family oxidoreductase [Pseudomonadota bacterium]
MSGKGAALILGARSDIARALALELGARGRPLRLAGRDVEALERDRADIALRAKVEVTAHAYDAVDLAGIDAFLDGLPETPEIVVSAVGLMGNQDENAADPELAARVVASNFTGPALTLEALARRMDEAGGRRAVIGISSVAGDRGRARNYVYGSAKAGFSEYLSGLRQKYARRPLHVMTVKPGFVATAMTEGMDLPAPLTATPEGLAKRVIRSMEKGRQVHYDFRWLAVMTIIKLIPEKIFMKLKF